MSGLKLYVTRGSPPAAAVQATLATLQLSYESVDIDFMAGEHLTPEHEKRNPQREVPVLENGGFFLSESVAIMQYLCDKYGGTLGEKLYPRDPKQRAIVNHRLSFHLSTLYAACSQHAFGNIFGLNSDAEQLLSKCRKVVSVLETILQRQGTRYVAGECLTLGDLSICGSILCLDAANFDLKPYPNVASWYESLKSEKLIWKVIEPCRDDLRDYINNPPSDQDLEKLHQMRDNKIKS